jgi:prevent-host-death family protein
MGKPVDPIGEAINVTEARRTWSDLLNRVFRREARVVIEKSGIPVAAVISYRDYEIFLMMKQKRDEGFKSIEQFSAAFRDVPPEEIERTLAKPYFQTRSTPGFIRDVLERLRRLATIVPITVTVTGVATHPEDDLGLATTVSAGADLLVTDDHHLLRLRMYEGVPITSPRDFLAVLDTL